MTGLVALMGPAIVKGTCLMPKYPKIQESKTITAFIKTLKCNEGSSKDRNLSSAKKSSTEKIRAHISVLRNRTGKTALPISDRFLTKS
ncbi:hypothetical protein SDC9_94512 [bioreactor metagenome]|uniref:Uncharacterized protein n=1 Tax=bioreactor metagenome TaxID=1076179 RepID=A0A645ADQ4_9ZZZZ